MSTQKTQKFIRENIEAYFEDNGDGTTTVRFGKEPFTMGTTHANTLKSLVQKKLSSKKTVFGKDAQKDTIDTLNQLAYRMIEETELNPKQKQEIKYSNFVKHKKLT